MVWMTSHGQNNRIFGVFDPLAWAFTLKESIFGLCYETQGGANLTGRGQVKLGFLAKIITKIQYLEVWAQKLQSFLLWTPWNIPFWIWAIWRPLSKATLVTLNAITTGWLRTIIEKKVSAGVLDWPPPNKIAWEPANLPKKAVSWT